MEIAAETGSEAYLSALELLASRGERAAPRGMATTELRNVTLLISDPQEVHVLRTGRKPSAAIAATEAAQLIAGVSSLEQLDLASGGRFSQFADGGRLRGAYGPRAWEQLQRVAQVLARDVSTRQAVVSVWRGDEGSAGRDVPCTLSYQFLPRAGHLELRTSMRSNDAWLGLPYDLEIARCLLLTMAWAVGMPPGPYAHTVGSLHAYDRDAADIARVTLAGSQALSREPVPPFMPLPAAADEPAYAVRRWELRALAAERVVLRRAEEPDDANPWHAAHVPPLPPGQLGIWEWETCRTCRYVTDGECAECVP